MYLQEESIGSGARSGARAAGAAEADAFSLDGDAHLRLRWTVSDYSHDQTSFHQLFLDNIAIWSMVHL